MSAIDVPVSFGDVISINETPHKGFLTLIVHEHSTSKSLGCIMGEEDALKLMGELLRKINPKKRPRALEILSKIPVDAR